MRVLDLSIGLTFRATVAVTFLMAAGLPLRAVAIYQQTQAPLEDRVNDLFSQLTQDEKLTLLEGTKFTTQPIPRLNIPPLAMADAGQGVRGGQEGTHGPATLFPAGVTMASTWDPELIGRVGKAIGEEVQNKGVGSQVLLGPAVNIHRSPLGGRNGEYFSEDPYLAARMAVSYIKGMQSSGAVACIKHYCCNNQEQWRDSIDVHVSERALREIYLPAFEAGVKEGHVDTVMASYNVINGEHATANHYLLTDVLKKCWGFDGIIMSDWGAVHGVGVVQAGNDLEMPGPHDLTLDALHKALDAGEISQAAVDDSVHRILRTIIRAGLMDGPKTPNPALVNSKEHQQLAYEAATKGIVLLKNEGDLLPINPAKVHTIAVIGRGSVQPHLGAEGSPSVEPPYFITPLQAITKRAGAGITILSDPETGTGTVIPGAVFFQDGDKSKPGLRTEYFDNQDFKGTPLATRVEDQVNFTDKNQAPPEIMAGPTANGKSPAALYVRWNGFIVAPETGTYFFNFNADKVRVNFDYKWLGEFKGDNHTFTQYLVAGEAHPIRIDYFQGKSGPHAQMTWITPSANTFPDAVAAAQKADLAIVCVSIMGQEHEAADRPSMDLPWNQNDLIKAVCAVNKNAVVVLNNGTPVAMKSWLAQTPGLVESWLPGMEGENALAAILFGDVNPSGKLVDTFGVNREDYPDFANYPGVGGVENYAEGIFVGYRHFDQAKLTPYFPFGFGLSYTTFAYSNLKLAKSEVGPTDKITATVEIKNTGTRAGEEVAQLYIHDPAPKIERAVRELKGFSKVALQPGETKTVSFEMPMRSLAYCDVPGRQWKADAGAYEIEVGASSRDLKQHATVHLTSTFTEPIPYLAEQFGFPADDLALGCATTASSVQATTATEPACAAANATDGKEDTRWSSAFSDPQWLAVDLGKVKTFDHVQILWEKAYAKAYTIEASQDGKSWQEVYKMDRGRGLLENIHFKPVEARWIRLTGTQRATTFGYSIYSFQVFAH